MRKPSGDEQLEAVVREILRLDPDGSRTGAVLRATLDQLYDGQRTRRYRWDQLYKTEKTHCGTLVEINLHREFQFSDGLVMDYSICGVEVDCKYSQRLHGWMIPQEANGHLCMLVWADDEKAVWSMGIVRVSAELLSDGENQDSKRTLSATGRSHVRWIFERRQLPPNVLLQLPRSTVDRIMALKSGQLRVNEIFRVASGRPIGRGVIATLAQQDDYMKRLRFNGGARSTLRREGIIVLGQYEEHRRIAEELGVPIPGGGESIGVRVARADSPGSGVTEIEGALWRVATDSDAVQVAPNPRHVKNRGR